MANLPDFGPLQVGPLRHRDSDRIKNLEAINAQLLEALEKYGVHVSACLAQGWKRGDNEYRCNCGLDNAVLKVKSGP